MMGQGLRRFWPKGAIREIVEEVGGQAIDQRLIFHVVNREVREDAGLYVTLIVDVDVLASTGKAGAGQGAVTPEVGHQKRPRVPDAHHTGAQPLAGSAVGIREVGLRPTGMYEKYQLEGAFSTIGSANSSEVISSRFRLVAVAEKANMMPRTRHRSIAAMIQSYVPSPRRASVAFATTLDAEGGTDVPELKETIGDPIVDHRADGEHQEHGLGMPFDNIQEGTTHETAAAQHRVDPQTYLFAFVDDALDHLFGQIVFVAYSAA